MRWYLDLLQFVLRNGSEREDRTSVGTLSVFGPQLEFDLQAGFPLVTTKRMYWKGIVRELLWFLEGSTSVSSLHESVHHWWEPWAEEGELGPIYGKQWRDWNGVDQMSQLIEGLRTNPTSRRHVLSTWNVSQLEDMALPPCHGVVTQFYVDGNALSCKMYQRSADLFLGFPVNIASYALLLKMVAQVVNLEPKWLMLTLGDAHIYRNHIEQVKTQLSRTPYAPPHVQLNSNIRDIDDFTEEDVKLIGYSSHDPIKGEIAI